MKTPEIALKLAVLCRQGKYQEAHDTLYANDALSVEMDDSMGQREVRGIDAIKTKGEAWAQMFNGSATSWCDDPIISGNSFACRMGFAGIGHDGSEIKGEELAVYITKDDKIIEERFFW